MEIQVLLKVELTDCSSKVLLPSGMSLGFSIGSIDLCQTIEECSRILGVHYNIKFIVTPLFNQDLELRISKTLGIKKDILENGDEINERSWNLLCYLFANRNSYEKNQLVFLSSAKNGVTTRS